jgi:hypothetical protein
MQKLKTKEFEKWALTQQIPKNELGTALTEVVAGNFDASLGGHIYKKRIRFKGKGKSGSGRTIVCYKKGKIVIFIHGFAKNEKSNLTKKELIAFKAFSNILLAMTPEEIKTAIKDGIFIEVK